MRAMLCKKNRAKRLTKFADIGQKLKNYAQIRNLIQMDSLNLLAVYIHSVRLNENYDMQKESDKKTDKVWRKEVKTVTNAQIQIL